MNLSMRLLLPRPSIGAAPIFLSMLKNLVASSPTVAHHCRWPRNDVFNKVWSTDISTQWHPRHLLERSTRIISRLGICLFNCTWNTFSKARLHVRLIWTNTFSAFSGFFQRTAAINQSCSITRKHFAPVSNLATRVFDNLVIRSYGVPQAVDPCSTKE